MKDDGTDKPMASDQIKAPPASPRRLTEGFEKGDKRYKMILRAAEQVLIDHGYHNFTLRKVAAAANISLGNLQYYFPNKGALTHALCLNIASEYTAEFHMHLAWGEPEEQFINLISQVILDLTEKRTTKFFPEIWSLSNHYDEVADAMEEMYSHYRSILAAAIQRVNPTLSVAQAQRLSLFISSSIEGFTIFTGYQKRWTEETPAFIEMSKQCFLWLVKKGKVPEG